MGIKGNGNKKNRIGIVHTLLIMLAAIGLGIVVLPQLIILLIALIISPDFIDVGRDFYFGEYICGANCCNRRYIFCGDTVS